jgi:predicted nuclease of predicted toxin-antitoxin system
MRIKLDENLPSSLVETLASLGHVVDTVEDEGITGNDDGVVWGCAQKDDRFLITQDLDFSDLRKFAPGTHCGILLVRLNNPSRRKLEEKVGSLFANSDTRRWNGAFIVLTDLKVRARFPET